MGLVTGRSARAVLLPENQRATHAPSRIDDRRIDHRRIRTSHRYAPMSIDPPQPPMLQGDATNRDPSVAAGGQADTATLRAEIAALQRQNQMLRETLDAAREEAEAANRMKSQFLGNVTHELRTPLNAVINFAQLIADEINGPLGAPEYREYAAQIGASGTELLSLIDELLDLARAEAGQLTITEGLAEPDVLIDAAWRMLAPVAAARHVTLTRAAHAALSPVRGDATRLRQVLASLIANALKFTPAGGEVRIDAAQDPATGLTISVRDTGIGIDATDLTRVMEPFEQVSGGGTESHPGIGLGLPLARHLAELHGGSLTLRSEQGGGTTAWFTLPVHRLINPSDAPA